MTRLFSEKWEKYWSDRTTPWHPSETPDFYSLHARELKVLFGEELPQRVLEIGCGNGALYPYFGFRKETYRGVDFSPSMLAVFRSKNPEIHLECREGSSYVDTKSKYDLIFSNAVVQYFDMPMLERHLDCARAMMEKTSLFVSGSIPWRVHRLNFHMGVCQGRREPGLLRSVPARMKLALHGDLMGRWYGMDEIKRLAERHGFSAEFYGSLAYTYRFHAVLRLQ